MFIKWYCRVEFVGGFKSALLGWQRFDRITQKERYFDRRKKTRYGRFRITSADEKFVK